MATWSPAGATGNWGGAYSEFRVSLRCPCPPTLWSSPPHWPGRRAGLPGTTSRLRGCRAPRSAPLGLWGEWVSTRGSVPSTTAPPAQPPLPMYCRVPQIVWARSPHCRYRERPKSVSLRCPVGPNTTWEPVERASPWMGCPHGWHVPKAVPPGSYLSHPGGCSPSEMRQALRWPLHAGGSETAPPHPLAPQPRCHPP